MKYFFWIFSFYILITKLVVNTGSDVTGRFAASSQAYIVAIATIAFIFLILIKSKKSLLKFKRIFFIIIPVLYYGLATATSIFSLIPALSIFRAACGIGFVIVGSTIGEHLSQFNLHKRINYFYKFLVVILVVGIIANVLYSFKYIVGFSIFYLQAGYIGLIFLYIGLWNLIDFLDSKKLRSLAIFFISLFSTALLHSFSAYIALYFAIIYLLLTRRFILIGAVLLVIPLIGFSSIINILKYNPDMVILGKPAGAYLIGSGRFAVYESALDAFMNLSPIRKIIGIGFMTERNILTKYDLTWSSDPHNSFIVSLLGIGVLGAFLYLCYILAPFFHRKKLKKMVGKSLSQKWLTMHIMFFVYGVTSSSYIAIPSMQLILFTIFSYMIFTKIPNYANTSR